MFTLKFVHANDAMDVHQASQFRIQPPDERSASLAKRVAWEDPDSNATFEQYLEEGGIETMIAENMNGKTTEIVRAMSTIPKG